MCVLLIARLLRGVGRWARKPINRTNRMGVVCCNLNDRPQTVPQLSNNRTLQFSKTMRLNMYDIFLLSSNAVSPLENPLNIFKCCMYTTLISRYRNIYLHVLALDYTGVAVSGKVRPVKPVNHTSWVAVVTPTDRIKSVRNRCIIELKQLKLCAHHQGDLFDEM